MSDLVLNPLSLEPLSQERSDYVKELRAVRRGARNAKRSGNPAKRAEATRVEALAPQLIRQVYIQDDRVLPGGPME